MKSGLIEKAHTIGKNVCHREERLLVRLATTLRQLSEITITRTAQMLKMEQIIEQISRSAHQKEISS